MDKFQSSRQKRISKAQEKSAAEDIGGQITAGSGAAKFSGGGDVRKAGELRIECKYTEKPYFILELAVLKKIQMEALKGGMEFPVLQLSFVTRTRSELFAIYPHTSGPVTFDPVFHTNRARIRLLKEELQGEILRHGSTQVLFHKKGGMGRVFDITTWGAFVDSRKEEEEDEC